MPNNYPPEFRRQMVELVRRLLYTTNAIESLNYQLRKVTKARERAANRQQQSGRSGYPGRLVEGHKTYGWPEALNELAAAYPGRIR